MDIIIPAEYKMQLLYRTAHIMRRHVKLFVTFHNHSICVHDSDATTAAFTRF